MVVCGRDFKSPWNILISTVHIKRSQRANRTYEYALGFMHPLDDVVIQVLEQFDMSPYVVVVFYILWKV